MKIEIAIAIVAALLSGSTSGANASPVARFEVRLVVECARGMQAFDLEADDATQSTQHLCVSPDVIMTQTDVVKVVKAKNNHGGAIGITYGQAAQARISQATHEFIGHRMAIMASEKMISAPVILTPITGDTLYVTGSADGIDLLLRDLTNGSKPL
jgi:preprotein translocase subunit SecD